MGRFPQGPAKDGSQRWLQTVVNHHPDILNSAIGIGPIEWVSPLAADDYAEYRDQAFQDLLGLTLAKRSLQSFWPRGGPQWDALGLAETGEAILLEAKSHIAEAFTACQASADSLELIRASFAEVAEVLGAQPGLDWSKRFYQYANRLAHAFLLHNLNGVPTQLVFLYFINDPTVLSPKSRREWEAAIAVTHEALGLRGRMPSYVRHAFIDVGGSVPVAL